MPKLVSIFLAVIFIFAGCEENVIVKDNEKVNRWIYQTMQQHYLWADFMPAAWEEWVNYNPSGFFSRLLYNAHDDIDLNDLYSRIVFTGTEEDYLEYSDGTEFAVLERTCDYGFAARLFSNNYFHITYVLPGSPAYTAGIRRGDCFRAVNGQYITDINQLVAFMGEDRIRLEFYYPETKTVDLVKSFYVDDPVHFDTIYELNPKTGYFVYNHFTDGDQDYFYNELKDVFARFHAAGVENIIADLRFNGGGELNAARKLASLLAPQTSLGNIYVYKERNSTYGDPDRFESENLLSASQMAGLNCNAQALYILTNKNTASASELLIHCLRPLYDGEGLRFIHAGEVTEGKNLGGERISNDSFQWDIYPITLRIYNIDKVSGYESGLVPDIQVAEYDRSYAVTDDGDPYVPLGQLGDIAEEPMLRRAMDDLYGIGGWQDLLPVGQQGTAGLSTRSAAAYGYSLPAPGREGRTTVRYRPLTEKGGR